MNHPFALIVSLYVSRKRCNHQCIKCEEPIEQVTSGKTKPLWINFHVLYIILHFGFTTSTCPHHK
jgi:hypothetical protein